MGSPRVSVSLVASRLVETNPRSCCAIVAVSVMTGADDVGVGVGAVVEEIGFGGEETEEVVDPEFAQRDQEYVQSFPSKADIGRRRLCSRHLACLSGSRESRWRQAEPARGAGICLPRSAAKAAQPLPLPCSALRSGNGHVGGR